MKTKIRSKIPQLAFPLLAVILVLAACAPADTPEPTAKVYTYEDMVVGFIQTGSEGGWRAANTASFKETAEQLGITLKFYDAQNRMENQISAFRNFIQDPEVNVIILAALEAAGWDEVLQEAQDAGKIVVLEDRRIDAPDTLYATYIGSDFVEEGRKSAVEMCKLLEGMEGANVVELVGNVGSSAAMDRGQTGRRYILAGENTTYLQAWRVFAEISGAPRPILSVGPVILHIAGLVGDVWALFGPEPDVNTGSVTMAMLPSCFSSERARAELGYQSRPLRESAQDAWDWFREHGYA